jgi:hypothetical protein
MPAFDKVSMSYLTEYAEINAMGLLNQTGKER